MPQILLQLSSIGFYSRACWVACTCDGGPPC